MSKNTFVQDLETVVYGCHAESQDQVRAIFEEKDIFTFSFAEYFLDEPVSSVQGIGQREVYMPFLQRAVMELKYSVKSTGRFKKTEFSSKTREWLRQVRELSRKGTKLSAWKSHERRIARFIRNRESWTIAETLYTGNQFLKVHNECPPRSERKLSYDIQIHLLANSRTTRRNPLRVVRVPIASAKCYYGQFVVVYQSEDPTAANYLNERLERKLNMLVADRYVPTLILLHASKWERELRRRLSIPETIEKLRTKIATESDPTRKQFLEKDLSVLERKERQCFDGKTKKLLWSKIKHTPLTVDWGKQHDKDIHEFEAALGKLWTRRKKHLEGSPTNDVQTIRPILEGIILDKYHIASPAMVDQVKEVVRGAKLMRSPKNIGDSLPSALVFGEAGSGKDKMARLIPTFTDEYLMADIITQNMAAIKPSLMAVPLMFGAELPKIGKFPGVFSITDNNRHVYILDELNSLDYDMQGSLLRLLENSEVSPLFPTGPPKGINALIVGIVNEDPEEVTREDELRLLKEAKEFLGKAEAARLYDALHRARRLRPDLVHRLKRGVYVRMPPLRDRREDIPLLFKHECSGHLESLSREHFGRKVHVHRSDKDLIVNVEYELEAYDVLMRRDLPWPGNIRQLQATARRTADEVWTWWMMKVGKHDNGKVEIEVRRMQVEKVLRNVFREQMGKKNKEDNCPD